MGWAAWQFDNDKHEFFRTEANWIFSSVRGVLDELARAVHTNPVLAKNKRWKARGRVRDRVGQILKDHRSNIKLDDEGFRSVEDQFMMLFQYFSEAKTHDRQTIYTLGEETIVRKLYGPDQEMNMKVDL